MRIDAVLLLVFSISACPGEPNAPEKRDVAPAAPVAEARPARTPEPAPRTASAPAGPTPAEMAAGDERLAQLASAPACPDLVAKLATCAEDVAFQTALFAGRPAGERDKLVAKLRADAKLWTRKGGGESTCSQWDAQGWGLDPGEKKPLAETCAVLGELMASNGGLPETK